MRHYDDMIWPPQPNENRTHNLRILYNYEYYYNNILFGFYLEKKHFVKKIMVKVAPTVYKRHECHSLLYNLQVHDIIFYNYHN
jgi:choline kinase